MCDGVKDCPHGEDEKKCAALIEDEDKTPDLLQRISPNFFLIENGHIFKYEDLSSDKKDVVVVESSSSESVESEVVSGREISSGNKNNLLTFNSVKTHFKTDAPNTRLEIYNYNDRGFLSVRKNGKWGKLCLAGNGSIVQNRYLNWSIEDLGKAVCKAITYQ